jgi:hypothetical protein
MKLEERICIVINETNHNKPHSPAFSDAANYSPFATFFLLDHHDLSPDDFTGFILNTWIPDP